MIPAAQFAVGTAGSVRAGQGPAWRQGARCAVSALALLVCCAQAVDVKPSPAASAQSPGSSSAMDADKASAGAAPGASGSGQGQPKPTRYAPDRFAGRASIYYGQVWGIDSLSVRLVQSGELVRFTYRILDPGKAQLLNDKQAEAKLDAPRAGVSLVVPVMEKVGQLRQTSKPEAGRSYWMTFSNKGRRVVRGDRVDVVIGQFHANNLIVD